MSQITEFPREIHFTEEIEELNRIYRKREIREFQFPRSLDVKVMYYRSGRELFFKGCFRGTVKGCCSRCLKQCSLPVEKNFDFILTPDPLPAKSRELNRDELGLSFYSAEEIDLSPLIQEQVLLALPMRPLCDERCRGLCPGCGADLNVESCQCASAPGDPRMAFFRNLRVSR